MSRMPLCARSCSGAEGGLAGSPAFEAGEEEEDEEEDSCWGDLLAAAIARRFAVRTACSSFALYADELLCGTTYTCYHEFNEYVRGRAG